MLLDDFGNRLAKTVLAQVYLDVTGANPGLGRFKYELDIAIEHAIRKIRNAHVIEVEIVLLTPQGLLGHATLSQFEIDSPRATRQIKDWFPFLVVPSCLCLYRQRRTKFFGGRQQACSDPTPTVHDHTLDGTITNVRYPFFENVRTPMRPKLIWTLRPFADKPFVLRGCSIGPCTASRCTPDKRRIYFLIHCQLVLEVFFDF